MAGTPKGKAGDEADGEGATTGRKRKKASGGAKGGKRAKNKSSADTATGVPAEDDGLCTRLRPVPPPGTAVAPPVSKAAAGVSAPMFEPKAVGSVDEQLRKRAKAEGWERRAIPLISASGAPAAFPRTGSDDLSVRTVPCAVSRVC